MGSSSMTLSMIDCPLPVEQRNPLAVRAPYCYADNCYRALFPCPSPWIVTQAVLYCATVSDDSATNYPTQAVAACGTGKERYISACSCPATNCPVKTTTQAAAVPSTVSSAVVLTTTAGNDTPENNAAPIPIPSPTTVMAAQGNVVPTQASENVGGEVDQDPDAGSGNEPTATEPATTVPPGTEEAPVDQVSSTHGQTANRGKSATGSHTLSISSPVSRPLSTPSRQSSAPLSLSLAGFPPGATSPTGSTTSSGIVPSPTTSLPGSNDLSRSQNGGNGVSVGLVAAIAVVSTLAALLLCGFLAYCCLKRRTARRSARARALTLSQESRPSEGFDAVSEWKPPIELPHHNTVAPPSSQAELEDSFIFPSRTGGDGDDVSPFPVSPSALSTMSSAAEIQGAPQLQPAELFVLPAELSGVHKSRD